VLLFSILKEDVHLRNHAFQQLPIEHRCNAAESYITIPCHHCSSYAAHPMH
jgi:hypothetical protein